MPGANGANNSMCWFMLVCRPNHLNISNNLALLGVAVRRSAANATMLLSLLVLRQSHLNRLEWFKSFGLGGGRNVSAPMWWCIVVYPATHLNDIKQSDSLAEAVRTQPCHGLCWCIAQVTTILQSIRLLGNEIERTNVMVYFGALLEPLESIKSICLAGRSGECDGRYWRTARTATIT